MPDGSKYYSKGVNTDGGFALYIIYEIVDNSINETRVGHPVALAVFVFKDVASMQPVGGSGTV